jgi:sugar phosphate isomerase/epimerase
MLGRLALSTVWNADRVGAFVPALGQARALGFESVELSGAAPDLAAVPAAIRELRLHIESADGRLGRPIQDETDLLEPAFAATEESDREVAVSALIAAAARARRAGTNRVLIRCGVVPVAGAHERFEDWAVRSSLGGITDEIREEAAVLMREREAIRDAHLDGACRTLHRIARADPEIRWLILPASRPHALPLPDEIEHLLAELPVAQPAYVHDTGAAAVLAGLGVASADEWLRVADRRLAAVRLSDAFACESGLPPGSGSVDWETVRDGLVAGLPRVLHVTRPSAPEEILEGARFLESAGIV